MTTILNTNSLIQNNYREASFRTSIVGTSDCNEFIPVYAIANHKLLVFKDLDIKVMEYSMPSIDLIGYSSRILRNYNDMYNHLKNSNVPIKYSFKVAGVPTHVYLIRGMVYDSLGNILMCLAINKDYLFNISADTLKTTTDATKFVLFLSNLLDDEMYKNFRKKLIELYIDPAKNLGIDVINTSRATNWLFKNNVKELKFKTVVAMNKHLKDELPKKVLEINI